MGSMMRKTQRRVETLISWIFAAMIVLLLAAGAYFLYLEVVVL